MDVRETTAEEVRAYWEGHPHGTQFLDADVPIGSTEFFDRIRPKMDCYRFPYIMARIEREARRLAGKHLLEIGCGLGFDAIEFVKLGVRVTATDLTPANVNLATRHFALAGVTPEAVRVEDAFDLSFPDATFDAVYSLGVLAHVAEPARMIAEIHRVLRPGGRALICHSYRRPSLFYVQLLRLRHPYLRFQGAKARRQDHGPRRPWRAAFRRHPRFLHHARR